MFSIIKLFIKKTFISFYREQNKFYTQKIVIKKDKILEKSETIFEKEEEFINFIKTSLLENTQTYISTIIMNYNQGCLDSCSHTEYEKFGINIENIKILCIDNRFSIFIGILEFNEFKKEMNKYKVDLIYSPYLIIDLNKSNKKNSLYILITKENIILSIYKTIDKPIYGSIYEFKDDNESQNQTSDDINTDIFNDDIEIDDVDEIEDLETLDDLDEIDEEIEENLKNEEKSLEETESNIYQLKEENEIINFIKDSIKDYYENYSNDFIENIYLFKNYDFDTSFIQELKDELFIDIEIKNIKILEELNNLAKKDINV